MDEKANELAKGSTTTISTKPKKVAAHTTTKGIANECYSLFITNLLQNLLKKPTADSAVSSSVAS